MLSTIDLLIKVACFVKNQVMFALSKAANLIKLGQGGQLYWAFPFSKGSLAKVWVPSFFKQVQGQIL